MKLFGIIILLQHKIKGMRSHKFIVNMEYK